ncbi:MAG: beta-ketoacyl synthase N-terminal-like domain-containing protein [Thermodesulfobacteriota bacterium]
MIGDGLAVTAWGRWGAPGLPDFWALGTDRREEPAVEALAVLARHCLDQAGLAPGPTVALALALGSAIRGLNEQHAQAVFSGTPAALSPRVFLYTTPNAVAARVSILLGLTGESLTLPDPGAPFWVAADLLRTGRAEVVLVGGASAQAGPSGHGRQRAALLCLEPATRGQNRNRPPQAGLRLDPTTQSGCWPDEEEHGVAEALVGMVEAGSPGAVACGRRGRVLVETCVRLSKDSAP